MEIFDIFQIFLKKVKIWSPRIGQGNFDMRSFSKILSFLDSSLRAASFYAIPSLRGAKSLPAASFPQTLWYLAGAAPPRGGAASPLPRRAEIFFSGSVFSLGACFSVGCWVVLSLGSRITVARTGAQNLRPFCWGAEALPKRSSPVARIWKNGSRIW